MAQLECYNVLVSLMLDLDYELQMAITSERLHKQSVVVKQICKLFPQRLVVSINLIVSDFSHFSHFQCLTCMLP